MVYMRGVRKMMFAIMVVETTGCSHQEQFAVCIRFCTSQLEINKVFVALYELQKQDAATLLKVILVNFLMYFCDCNAMMVLHMLLDICMDYFGILNQVCLLCWTYNYPCGSRCNLSCSNVSRYYAHFCEFSQFCPRLAETFAHL